MREPDILHRFLFENTGVRGELVHLDETWQAVLARADYPDAVRRVLGEAMASVALLAATVKFGGSLTLQIRGSGPITLLVVQARPAGGLRGLAKWRGTVPSAPLEGLFGAGQLAITIDPGQGCEQYQGLVSLEGNSLADAIVAYFERSEQLPTCLWLAADTRSAAGLLLQNVPGDSIDPDAWVRAEQRSATVTGRELLELPAIEIVRRLYHEEDVRFFSGQPVTFRCSCSRERSEAMLRALGYDAVKEVLSEEGHVKVTCEFCNSLYAFDAVDTEKIFAVAVRPSVGETRH